MNLWEDDYGRKQTSAAAVFPVAGILTAIPASWIPQWQTAPQLTYRFTDIYNQEYWTEPVSMR